MLKCAKKKEKIVCFRRFSRQNIHYMMCRRWLKRPFYTNCISFSVINCPLSSKDSDFVVISIVSGCCASSRMVPPDVFKSARTLSTFTLASLAKVTVKVPRFSRIELIESLLQRILMPARHKRL